MESKITDIMEPFGIVGSCWKDEEGLYITLGNVTLCYEDEYVQELIQGLELLVVVLKDAYKESV